MSTIPLLNRNEYDDAKLVFNEFTKQWDLMKHDQRIRSLDEFEHNFVDSAYCAGQQSVTVTK